MGKKIFKKKQLKKKNYIENPDVSDSSASEYEGEVEQELAKELDEKLENQGNEFEEDDLDVFNNNFQEEEENLDENEDNETNQINVNDGILNSLDKKLIEILERNLDGIDFCPKSCMNFRLNYIQSILFYFLKKNKKNEKVENHPVISYLQKFEENYPRMKRLEKKLILNAEQNYLPKPILKNTEEKNLKENTEIVQIENNDINNPRLITRNMFKNRGIPKIRNKKNFSNPRIKQKYKFRKAVEVMVSRGQKRKKKFKEKGYSGEQSGIRIGIDRTINID